MTRSETLLIRPARLDDLPQLVELLDGAVPDCLPETVWQLPWTWTAYQVAETEEGDVVAAGSLQRVDPRSPLAEIRGLIVAESHRGQGLASRVVRALLDEAERRGLTPVCVTKKPAFFARLGFDETPPVWVGTGRTLAPHKPGAARVGMVAHLGDRRPEAA